MGDGRHVVVAQPGGLGLPERRTCRPHDGRRHARLGGHAECVAEVLLEEVDGEERRVLVGRHEAHRRRRDGAGGGRAPDDLGGGELAAQGSGADGE